MRRALLMVVVTTLACPGPSPGPVCVAGGGGGGFFDAGFGGGSGQEQLFHTSEQVVVPISLAKAFDCSGGSVAASAVHTSVVGPNNLPLDHTNTGLSMDGNTYDTTVKFLPTVPGPYHITARFDPNLGIVQIDLRVAENRSLRDPIANVFVPSSDAPSCSAFGLTLHDTALCLRSSGIVVYRDGARAQTLPAGVFAVVGDTVWLAHDLVLERYVDNGAGMLELGLPALNNVHRAVLLAGNANEVTLVEAAEAHRYVLESGMLVPHETWTFALSDSMPTMAASIGGKFSVMNDSSVCVGGATAGATECQNFQSPQHSLSFGVDGMWHDTTFAEIGRWSPGAASPVTVTLPPGAGVGPLLYFGNRPLLTTLAQVYSVADGADPYLIEWTPKAGLMVVGVGVDWAAVRDNSDDIHFVR